MRILPILLLAACTTKTEDAPTEDGAVTWHRDVEPLLQRSCATCHVAGGLGGFDLTDYTTAKAYASAIAYQTANGLMPPPAMDPNCQPYAGDDRMNLSADDIALLGAWSEAGAPEGDPANAPAPVSWGARMEDPDLVLTMPIEHTVAPDLDGNEYFCEVVDNPLDQSVFITGIDVEVGDAAVVHHMILAIDDGGDAGTTYGDTDPSDGFDCRDPIMESDWRAIHAWAPGMDATLFPEGKGMLLGPNDQIVIQMHYYAPDGGVHTDQSSYLLQVSEDVDTTIQLEAVGPTDFVIPAGDPAYTDEESIENTFLDLTVYGVFPHMHLLGSAYHTWLEKPDGTEVCLAQGNYEFGHQAFYMYDEPIAFELGDTLAGGCTWDNSADNPQQYNDPPQTITWGEGSNQEMCYYLIYFSIP